MSRKAGMSSVGQKYLAGGRTIVHCLIKRPSHMPRGRQKPVVDFSTQLWLLHGLACVTVNDALQHNWLIGDDKPIRILDAMCSTCVMRDGVMR